MSVSSLQVVSRIGAEHLLNSLPQGVLIAGLAWVLLRVTAPKNSTTRFVVWFAALCAMVAAAFIPDVTAAGHVTHALTRKLALPDGLALALFIAWVVITTAAILRVAVGFWSLRKLRNSCHPVNMSDLPLPLQEVVARFAAERNVAVCTSSAVRVPMAIGFFKPAIIVPEWSLRDLTADELKVILLHEFAHLQRRDDWTNLVQQLVRTIFFFHPVVMWVERRLSLEREMACDDVVLAQTENPRAYAECLVSLAEKSFLRRGLAMAQAAISHTLETCLRLARILDVNRPRASSGRKPALAITAGFIAGCLVVLPHVPRLSVVGETSPAPDFSVARETTPQAAVIHAVAGIEDTSPRTQTRLSTSLTAVNRSHTLTTGNGAQAFAHLAVAKERLFIKDQRCWCTQQPSACWCTQQPSGPCPGIFSC